MKRSIKQQFKQVDELWNLKNKLSISEGQVDLINRIRAAKEDQNFSFELQIYFRGKDIRDHLFLADHSKELLVSILSHIETNILANHETDKKKFDDLFQEFFAEGLGLQ
ncbi:hypothetical protein [Leptospira bandrabouensis]|uniref:hypothetical protein n=1 Tax=Leptospira bandrabouensis TaxID=2484903 RepID=UPI001EE9741B|nr:hypothetical protein [Leptospira bandrabouensis]MCG6144128.1 hypothetical protein [Leptospira bandrabouensis]MCG6159789.1 hypothetical protein [Leptospira bandrabouensis]MCG6163722.1 hypothetical protein [Leptospira bandrabouensis]